MDFRNKFNSVMNRSKANIYMVVLTAFLVLLLSGCGIPGAGEKTASQTKELTVSAAASLQEVLTEMAKSYKLKNPSVDIIYNFASSGTLQKQIEEGAPVDLFISAGKPQMDALEEKKLLLKDTRLNLLKNELVLITVQERKDITGFEDLAKSVVAQIAIGTPETVPAGKYAKEALENLKLWDELGPKFVLAKDIKQVLTYVETGNVDAGFVYLSDSVTSQKVKVIMQVPSELHAPIVYPAAIIEGSKQKDTAQSFLTYLQSAEAAKIFEQYGFSRP